MKKDFIIDYLGCILFRVIGSLIRSLPEGLSFSLGRGLGGLLYYLDYRHRAIAYANIKKALGGELTRSQINKITKKFYRSFGLSLIEIFFIPLVNQEYLNNHAVFEGLDNIDVGFKGGKGVILLGVHEGSWELSNVICANLGFPFYLFVRNQRYPRLNQLLNSYRVKKGCRIIERENELREAIKALRHNEAIGMTADQGGRDGILVKFFGKEASMPQGAVRLALKYSSSLIPAFYARFDRNKIKVIIDKPFELKRTADTERDIRDNLQEIIRIFEKYIRMYPTEYLWTYKIWKYSREKNILVLSDGKTGHLRQAQAVAGMIDNFFKDEGIKAKIDNVEVKFKNKFSKNALTISSCLSGKYECQGCLWCLKIFLREDIYDLLSSMSPDVIVSCGSSIAAVNFILSRQSLSRSVVIMRPSILSTRRFDLVIMPQHDRPPKRKNIVVTDGALNLINDSYLKEQSQRLLSSVFFKGLPAKHCLGLLIGGDTKGFLLGKDTILETARQIKSICEKFNFDLLVTTSRRTSREVENIVKEEFKNYDRCKLLIIANENNIAEAVGGILGLSSIVIVSAESISMISEAASSKKYVLVFDSGGLNKKHRRLLNHFARNKYIYLTEPHNLSGKIEDIWLNKPQVNVLKDAFLVKEAIKKIL